MIEFSASRRNSVSHQEFWRGCRVTMRLDYVIIRETVVQQGRVG
jgi:hypothetical protein